MQKPTKNSQGYENDLKSFHTTNRYYIFNLSDLNGYHYRNMSTKRQ